MAKKTNTTINNNTYFRVTATVGKDADGKPIRRQFYGESKKEAEAKRDEYMFNIKSGLNASYEKLVFLSAYKQWFEAVHKPTLALSSVLRYENDNKRIIASMLATMKLVDIKSINIQQAYNEMMNNGVSANSVRNVGKLLSPFFVYAVKTDLIVKNPMLAVIAPKERKIDDTKRVLSKPDLYKIIEHAKDNPSAFIFVFLAFTGARQGEALALKNSDIDKKDKSIRINKSVSHLTINGYYQPVVSTTKTIGSTREIPLLSELNEMLSNHVILEKEKHEKLNLKHTQDSILFSSETGGYIEAKNLRRRFERMLNRLEIEQVTLHALRHTFCTILAENGVNLKTASELMGHSDVKTTLKIYTHVHKEEKKRSISTLSDTFMGLKN